MLVLAKTQTGGDAGEQGHQRPSSTQRTLLSGTKAWLGGSRPVTGVGTETGPCGGARTPHAARLTSLEPVDVLCVEPQQQPLLMQQSQEVVNDVGPVVSGVQLLGQSEKGLGVVKEKRQLENGLRVGDVVLLEVAVVAAPRRPAEKWGAESGRGRRQGGRGARGRLGT